MVLLPTEHCKNFMVCEGHLDLFRDVEDTVLKGVKCINGGCNWTANRVASWKTSIVLSLALTTSVPIGALLCRNCSNITVDGEEALMEFIKEEHRFD